MIGLVILAATLALHWRSVWVAHREGDEVIHALLVEQLSQGRYTLRGTWIEEQPEFFAPALYDRPVHYNPPFFNLLLLLIVAAFPFAPMALVPVLCTAGTATLLYAWASRRSGPAAGGAAVVIFLLCPIGMLVAGKLWAESILGLLLLAALFITDSCIEHRPGRARAELLGLGLLLAAAALTKVSALFAVPALAWAALQVRDARTRRHTLMIVVLVPVLMSAAWLAWVALQSGEVVPSAVRPSPEKFQNGFVSAMASKHPLSFFYIPLLLNPAYLLALASLPATLRARSAHLWLYPLGIFAAATALAWAGVGTYHNKYISFGLPPLALLAALGVFPPDGAAVTRTGRFVRIGLLAASVAALGFQLQVLWPALPVLAEVDPRMAFGFPAWMF